MCDDSRHASAVRKSALFSRLSSPAKLRISEKSTAIAKPEREPLDLVTAMPIIVQSPTPTDDDDDVPSTPLRPIRRRKSRLERWIEDQHAPPDARQGDEITRRSSRKSYPYLAYPDMRRARSASRDQDSESMAEGFVLVDGDDETGGPSRDPEDVFEAPAVLSTPQSTRNYTSLLRTPPSLRAFHVSLSPSRRASSSTYDPSLSLSHHSIFQRHSHSMGRHGRTASDGSVALPQLQQDEHDSPSPALSAKPHGPWTFRRPSVLGTFAPPDASADEGSAFHLSPPRRSFSSTLTFSSGTTGVSTDPCTPNHGSPSSVSSTPSKGPNHSLWSLPPGASHLQDPPNSEASVLVKPGSLRLPFSLKASSKPFRHVPTVLPISRDRRKKKLIVSGIAKGDQPRLEGVRKWCESFGEVNQITRMPNGDLHIDFRKAEVADTVCRVNARVHISGVGSVALSWYTGKRP